MVYTVVLEATAARIESSSLSLGTKLGDKMQIFTQKDILKSEERSEYEIIDNFLSLQDFEKIQYEMLMSGNITWRYNPFVSFDDTTEDDYYFTHRFYDKSLELSNCFYVLSSLLNKMDIKAIRRIKANLYPKSNVPYEDKMHIDFEFPHKGAIFYINTNNGYTKLQDGTKIDSVANRLLLFNPHEPHCSARCTDEKVRVNINFNYF